jgi:hypothetical protein
MGTAEKDIGGGPVVVNSRVVVRYYWYPNYPLPLGMTGMNTDR